MTHPAAATTVQRFRKFYRFPNYVDVCKAFVGACTHCQRLSAVRTPATHIKNIRPIVSTVTDYLSHVQLDALSVKAYEQGCGPPRHPAVDDPAPRDQAASTVPGPAPRAKTADVPASASAGRPDACATGSPGHEDDTKKFK